MRSLLFLQYVALVLVFWTSENAIPTGCLALPVNNLGGLDLGGAAPGLNPRLRQTQIERWLNIALRRINRFLRRIGFPPLEIRDGSAVANLRLNWGPNGFYTVPE
ncbi:uncharacterized protein LOC119390837 [Rhipicephalus sanguineus]|uniref:uncharacterized protein LOC119390837 n=1 Tax=Rhipicephalus sanguineus TaxID=34632 RepID=UPI00189516C7|nr:uncharacterized protein LOC119390837 [Rhipicephalus sanguineus]